MNAPTSSRYLLCPNDDSHMEITSAYESSLGNSATIVCETQAGWNRSVMPV